MKAAILDTAESIVTHLQSMGDDVSKAEKMALVVDVLNNKACGSDLASELMAVALEAARRPVPVVPDDAIDTLEAVSEVMVGTIAETKTAGHTHLEISTPNVSGTFDAVPDFVLASAKSGDQFEVTVAKIVAEPFNRQRPPAPRAHHPYGPLPDSKDSVVGVTSVTDNGVMQLGVSARTVSGSLFATGGIIHAAKSGEQFRVSFRKIAGAA